MVMVIPFGDVNAIVLLPCFGCRGERCSPRAVSAHAKSCEIDPILLHPILGNNFVQEIGKLDRYPVGVLGTLWSQHNERKPVDSFDEIGRTVDLD